MGHESRMEVAVVILAVFQGLAMLLGVWLAHRRIVADAERRAFEETMLQKFGLEYDTKDWARRQVRRNRNR